MREGEPLDIDINARRRKCVGNQVLSCLLLCSRMLWLTLCFTSNGRRPDRRSCYAYFSLPSLNRDRHLLFMPFQSVLHKTQVAVFRSAPPQPHIITRMPDFEARAVKMQQRVARGKGRYISNAPEITGGLQEKVDKIRILSQSTALTPLVSHIAYHLACAMASTYSHLNGVE